MTAPVTRGFLFVGGWVDLDYEIIFKKINRKSKTLCLCAS